jgi:hypothetical protein
VVEVAGEVKGEVEVAVAVECGDEVADEIEVEVAGADEVKSPHCGWFISYLHR